MQNRSNPDGPGPDPADIRRIERWPTGSSEDAAIDISVLIPCYHAERHIADALASVEAQSGLPLGVRLEAIVVADGRPSDADAVRRLVAQRVRSYPFSLTLIELARNVGAGLARCHAWRQCRGELVAFLDDDDLWHPRKLALQHALHRRHPGQIASGHLYGDGMARDAIEDGEVRMLPVGFRSLLVRSPLATPSLVVRRALWPRGPEPFRLGEDGLLNLMIASTQSIMQLQAVLARRSPTAPPVLADRHGLTRKRWRTRRAQWRNYVLLVRRGHLSAWRLPYLMAFSALLLARRLILDIASTDV